MPAVGVWGELPAPPVPLIGRNHDTAAVRDLVAACSVVTLTGVSGVGKTPLAVEVATRQRDEGSSVVFVQLDRVSDHDDVVDAVFAALHLPDLAHVDAEDGLVRLLRNRRCLLPNSRRPLSSTSSSKSSGR